MLEVQLSTSSKSLVNLFWDSAQGWETKSFQRAEGNIGLLESKLNLDLFDVA